MKIKTEHNGSKKGYFVSTAGGPRAVYVISPDGDLVCKAETPLIASKIAAALNATISTQDKEAIS